MKIHAGIQILETFKVKKYRSYCKKQKVPKSGSLTVYITECIARYQLYLLTSFAILHALVIAIKKLSIEELDGDYSEDEMKEKVDNEDVEDILE